MELRGISCINLETTSSKRKSCVVSRSFGKKIENLENFSNFKDQNKYSLGANLLNNNNLIDLLYNNSINPKFDPYKKIILFFW